MTDDECSSEEEGEETTRRCSGNHGTLGVERVLMRQAGAMLGE